MLMLILILIPILILITTTQSLDSISPGRACARPSDRRRGSGGSASCRGRSPERCRIVCFACRRDGRIISRQAKCSTDENSENTHRMFSGGPRSVVDIVACRIARRIFPSSILRAHPIVKNGDRTSNMFDKTIRRNIDTYSSRVLRGRSVPESFGSRARRATVPSPPATMHMARSCCSFEPTLARAPTSVMINNVCI